MNKPSITSRIFQMLFFMVIGAILTYQEIIILYPAITSGTIENLSFSGRETAYSAIYGYKALVLHVALLIIGLIFLVLSIEQVKLLRKEWRV